MAGKRPISFIMAQSKYITNSDGTPHSKKSRRRKRRKSVAFLPCVSMQCFFHNDPQQQDHTSWLKKDDLDKIKIRAKSLSRLHILQVRSQKINSQDGTPSSSANTKLSSASISNVTRCQIMGESLRGMEHLTDVANGRKRRRVRTEALQAVEYEQREQLI